MARSAEERAWSWHTRHTIDARLITPKTLRTVFHQLANPILFLALGLSIVATHFCLQYDWRWDPHVTLLVSPLVFPLAFSINSSYTRRERVLEELANFKAAAIVTYWCHRDWARPAGLTNSHAYSVKDRLERLVDRFFIYMRAERREERMDNLKKLYGTLDQLAGFTEVIRGSGLPGKEPLCTRLIHYHNLMCASIEKVRIVCEYRTPRSIRDLFKLVVFLLPIIMAPYFVEIAHKTGQQWNAYYTSVIVSLLFGCLQSCEDSLDDPFDGVGAEDDINLNQLILWKRTIWVPVDPSAPAHESSRPDRLAPFVSDDELGFDPFAHEEQSLAGLSRAQSVMSPTPSQDTLGLSIQRRPDHDENTPLLPDD